MSNRKVIFRVDGDSSIGLGHISRCCALAEMLRDIFDIYFFTRANDQAVLDEISSYCTQYFKLSNNVTYEEESELWTEAISSDDIVVLDGYYFNTGYQQQIKNKSCKLVCIDDIHAYHFVADAVINHAPEVDKSKYSCEPYTKLYLGTDYLLLKKIFLEQAKKNSYLNDKESSVLICLGGADSKNYTKKILQEVLLLAHETIINIVVGSAYKFSEGLLQLANQNKCIKIHRNIKPRQMLELMKLSAVAITSASTIALEYLCVKGNLFLMCTADNQKDIYNALVESKCASPYELLKDISSALNTNSDQCYLIDGKSNNRLIDLFEALSVSNELQIKKAEQNDADILFNWANDTEVRQQSLSQHSISYQEHVSWFLKKMADPDCSLYIAYRNNLPVGMIRFDVANVEECTISYLVDSLQRGKNIGTELINKGTKQFLKDSRFKGSLKATVKKSNIPSLKIFKKLGFKNIRQDTELVWFEKAEAYDAIKSY